VTSTIDGTLFAVGGWKYGDQACNDCERLDLGACADGSSPQWKMCPPLTMSRKLHGVTALNNTLYAFGGLTANSFRPQKTAERYADGDDSWSPICPLPVGAKCCACTAAGKVYVLLWGEENHGQVLQYDDATDTYTTIAPLPVEKWQGFAAAGHPTKPVLYLVGGGIKSKWSGLCYRYDVSSGDWGRLPDLPLARRRLACAIVSSDADI
jgi:hypothetical protein